MGRKKKTEKPIKKEPEVKPEESFDGELPELKKPSKEDVKEFKKTLSEIEKQFGDGVIVTASAILNVEKVPTGNLLLDILTEGGLPRGSISLLYGPFNSGKTVTALKQASMFTRQEIPILYIACEGDIDKKWVKKIGNNLDHFHIARPNNLEDAIDLADVAVRSRKFGMVIFDSVTAGIPKEAMNKKTEKDQYALQARRNGKLVQKLTSGLQPENLKDPETYNNTMVLLIAHLRNKVGVMFGSPETLPGGEAIKHHSSYIIKVRPGAKLVKGGEKLERGDKKEIVGREMKFIIERSKYSTPLVSGVTDFFFETAKFNNAKVLLTYAVQYGIIVKEGAWYSYGDIKEQGQKKLLLALKEKKLLTKIKQQLIEVFGDV